MLDLLYFIMAGILIELKSIQINRISLYQMQTCDVKCIIGIVCVLCMSRYSGACQGQSSLNNTSKKNDIRDCVTGGRSVVYRYYYINE